MTQETESGLATLEAVGAAKRSYSVPAAEKALDILEFMAGQPEGMTMTELAGALGRSVHELYRVILVLEARGYLYRRANSDRYRISLKLFELAHQTPSVRQLTDSALPIMQGLAPAAQQSCHLAVLSGHEALIVLQIELPAADALFGDARRQVRFRGDEFRRRHLRLFARRRCATNSTPGCARASMPRAKSDRLPHARKRS